MDAKIKEYHQKEADEAKAYVRKLSVVNLAEKSEEAKEPEVVKIDLVSWHDVLTHILYIMYTYQKDHIL